MKKTNKKIPLLDAKEIIRKIEKKYGPKPVFSSKYESVKKSVSN